MKRIELLEGIRGPLAIWVMVTHCIQRSGFHTTDLDGFFLTLRSGGNAVDAFMILSGFVITLLVVRDCEDFRFRRYICQRFFRLFPVLVFALLLAVFLSDLKGIFLQNMPNGSEKSILIAKYNEAEANFWAIFLVKITMLHGLVPDNIIPNMSNGILEPAWSISLEWQFYLIAPLLIISLVSKDYRRLLFLLFIIYCVYLLSYFLGVNWDKSFLPRSLGMFFIGIISFLVFRNRFQPLQFILVLSVFFLGLVAFLTKGNIWSGPHLSLFLWGFVLGMLFFHWFRVLNRVLTSPVLLHFGKISYSFYLLHMPALVISQLFLNQYFSLEYDPLILTLFTFFVTYLLSLFSFYTIEKPGISIGKRVSFAMERNLATN